MWHHFTSEVELQSDCSWSILTIRKITDRPPRASVGSTPPTKGGNCLKDALSTGENRIWRNLPMISEQPDIRNWSEWRSRAPIICSTENFMHQKCTLCINLEKKQFQRQVKCVKENFDLYITSPDYCIPRLKVEFWTFEALTRRNWCESTLWNQTLHSGRRRRENYQAISG